MNASHRHGRSTPIAGTILAAALLSLLPATGVPACDCRCEMYAQTRQASSCSAQCSSVWSTLGCDTQAELAAGQWDAETQRYRASLAQLGIAGSMYDIQSTAFSAAPEARRGQMWADLDTLRGELAKEDMQELLEIRAQIEAGPTMDAETLRYKAALQQAGKSAEEVNGLVTLFSIGRPIVRQALWGGLKSSNAESHPP